MSQLASQMMEEEYRRMFGKPAKAPASPMEDAVEKAYREMYLTQPKPAGPTPAQAAGQNVGNTIAPIAAQTPAARAASPTTPTPAAAQPPSMVGPPDPYMPDRMREAARALDQQRQGVFRQLRELGPIYGQTPQQAAAREQLIGQRQAIEKDQRPLSGALNPGTVVTPEQAARGRQSLYDQLRTAELYGTAAAPPQDPNLTGPTVPGSVEFLQKTYRTPEQAAKEYETSLRDVEERRRIAMAGAQQVMAKRDEAENRLTYEKDMNQRLADAAKKASIAGYEGQATQAGFASDPEVLRMREAAAIAGLGAQTEKAKAEAQLTRAQSGRAMTQDEIERLRLEEGLRQAKQDAANAMAETPELNQRLSNAGKTFDDMLGGFNINVPENADRARQLATDVDALLGEAGKLTGEAKAAFQRKLRQTLPNKPGAWDQIKRTLLASLLNPLFLPTAAAINALPNSREKLSNQLDRLWSFANGN